jgi:hypothetical protein
VVDLSGYHTVCVRFCRCSKNGLLDPFRQLMRFHWYPASTRRPKTAFTYDLLDTYHKISLQGKLNLYDFYNAIMQKTDNHGRSKPKVGRFLPVAILINSSVPKSIGTMRCRGASDNGVTSRTLREVPEATHLLQSMNSTMGLLPLNAPPAPTRNKIYLWDGIPTHARESS